MSVRKQDTELSASLEGKGMMKPGVIGKMGVACGCSQQALSVPGVSGLI